MAEHRRGPVRPGVIEGAARPLDPAADPALNADPAASALPDQITPDSGTLPHDIGPTPSEAELQPALESGAASDESLAEPAAVPTDPEPVTYAATGQESDETPRPAAVSVPRGRRRSSAFPTLLSTLLGALLGAGLVYALDYYGYWPVQPQASDPRLEELQTRLSALESAPDQAGPDLEPRIAALEGAVANAGETAAALQSLRQQVEQLALSDEGGAPVDLTPLRTELAALSQRVEALAAARPQADTQPVGAEIETLRAEVSTLSEQISALSGRLEQSEQVVAGLNTAVEGVKAAEAERAAAAAAEPEVDPAVELAQIIDELERRVTAGEPYAEQLDAAGAAVPDLAPTPAAIERAASGLPTHAELTDRLSAAVPDMLAARPADPNADWTAASLDWLRSTLAIRPTGEVQGEGPDAIVSQIEGALGRQDYTTAHKLFETLPEPMRSAVGTLPTDIAARADAQALIEQLRAASPVANPGETP